MAVVPSRPTCYMTRRLQSSSDKVTPHNFAGIELLFQLIVDFFPIIQLSQWKRCALCCLDAVTLQWRASMLLPTRVADGRTDSLLVQLVCRMLARFDGRALLWSRVRNNGNWPFTDGAFLLPPFHLTPFSRFWANRETAEVGLVNIHFFMASHTLVHPRATQSINTKAIAGILSSYLRPKCESLLLIVLYH